jgi:AcrR family transcriptional regulator
LKAKRTRELLLHTAIKLFAQKGYADTSIREIGSNAGVSTSILYHYFKNKEEILFEVTQTASHELIHRLKEIQNQILDPAECLREMLMTHMVHFSLKRKEEGQIVAADSHLLKGKRRQICRQMQQEIYNLYGQKLKELAEKGRMNNMDRTVVAFSMFGMINTFFGWYREGGRLSKEEVAQNIVEFIFHGILKE